MPFQPILSSDTFASHLPPPVGPGPEIVDSNEAELEIIPPVIGIGECQLLMQSSWIQLTHYIIDLGTTNSCASVKRGETIQVIPNDQGQRVTPTWVSFTGGERL